MGKSLAEKLYEYTHPYYETFHERLASITYEIMSLEAKVREDPPLFHKDPPHPLHGKSPKLS